MPHQKKKKRTSTLADISAFNVRADFMNQARNMETTITAEDRTAMQNARQRHLQGIGNHEPSLHVVVPDANNLPNAGQGGFLNRLATAVDAALAPVPPEVPPEGNRLLEAVTVFLGGSVAASPVTAQPTNPIDDVDDGLIVDVDDDATVADTTTAVNTRPQQRRTGRLSSNVRLARQQSARNKKQIAIDPIARTELLNLDKAKKNRRSEKVLKTRMCEATRFILFLHSHHPELVKPDLHAQLIVASQLQYTTDRVKDLSLRKIIEKTINENEDTDNEEKVIKFNEVLPDVIGDYLCQREY